MGITVFILSTVNDVILMWLSGYTEIRGGNEKSYKLQNVDSEGPHRFYHLTKIRRQLQNVIGGIPNTVTLRSIIYLRTERV